MFWKLLKGLTFFMFFIDVFCFKVVYNKPWIDKKINYYKDYNVVKVVFIFLIT